THHQSEHINLPLEISLYISDYILTQMRCERINVPLANYLLNNVDVLIDCLSSLERITSTPIPLAYHIHLLQTVWIYCLSLPFQLVESVGWSTIEEIDQIIFVDKPPDINYWEFSAEYQKNRLEIYLKKQ
ncbi:1010_t:CDS:2, partial [Scutellospora calospora]